MQPDAIDDNVGPRRRAEHVALAIVVVVAIIAAVPPASASGAAAVTGPSRPLQPAPSAAASAPSAPGPTTTSRIARGLRRQVPEIDPDHVVVRFRSLPADISSRLARAGASIARSVTGTTWTELATPNRSARRARIELARDPAIAQVSFSYIRHALTIPNDPRWATTQSAYLAPLRLDRAWDIAKGSGITVAVVDTGVDRSHPDLVGGLVAGHNVVDPSRPPDDDNGHGTMTSGIVAARTNNQRGVVGIAPGAKVMPIKVLDSGGSGSDTDIAIGIDWARTHHANVINLSLGGAFDDPMLAAAVQNAIAANIVVVAAAGNDGADTIGFPASYPGVLAVSATSHTGALTAFSSYGWRVDVAAPGLDITSTAFDGGYATESGTSFSSPIVAGVAALLRAKHRSWTQAQVAAQIRNTARDFGLPGVDPAFGHGIVDPLGALGGPPAAPHPSARAGADEPNDTPADVTVLAVGAAHPGAIAPETDEDWYRVSIANAGWYSVRVVGGAPSFDHQLDPVVELYKPDMSFTASQELSGGDLVVDVSAIGNYFVRVRNFNGSTAPYTISVTTRVQPPRFAGPLDLNFGFATGSVGVADVDGDNRKDMLFAFGQSSPLADTLVVFSQTAHRSLAVSAALPTHAMAGGGLTTGDLDGDGHADIAIPVNQGVDVFTHVGPTTTPVLVPLTGARQLAIADVDGDTHNDLVAIDAFGVRVLWGPMPFAGSTQIPASPLPTSIAVGNLTGHTDGLLDIATSGVKIFRQTSLHAFGTGAVPPVTGTADVAVGDLTHDGKDDLVASRPASAALALLVQNGTVVLTRAADAPVAEVPRPVAIADIDHDLANDIVVLHDFAPPGSDPASVGWVRQTSPGVFDAEETFSINDFAQNYDAKALAVGDVEGDGRDDLVVATSFGVSLLVQNSGVLPTLAPAWITDAFPQSMATNVAAGVHPTITLGRAVTNFGPTKVQLRNGSGAVVASTSAYNSGTRTITITPNAPLPDGRYAMHIGGLADAGGATLADAGSTFTVGPAPDETAPRTTLHSPPSGTRSTAQATLSFTADEAGATFWCSFANEPYHPCRSPQRITAPPGKHAFRVFARDAAGNEDATPAAATWTYRPPVHGYWMLGRAGAIYAFGTAPDLGGAATARAVDFDISPTGHGYWIVDASGRVFPFGDAATHGNAPALTAGDTVTSISRTASGKGYWLFTARGRVYPFGDAPFYGDMRNTHLNGPVLDSVRTSSGRGYYMVASDGGVFSFGDARFHGSTGAMRLNAPVRSLVPDPDGAGYWLVAVDGGVFAFDAPFRGSMGGTHLNRPVVGMVAFGNGYLMVGADGGIFDFSSKPFLGSLGGRPPSIPIVSVAAFG